MIFNSIPFVGFFVVFFILYWFVFNRSLKLQNLLVLAGCYLFYAWWDWRFLSMLIGSSVLNYFLGIYMYKTKSDKRKRWLLYIGLLQGLGGLIYFKYFNFFITSFADAFSVFNINLGIHTIKILLPLGISFYTFRTLSYLLDIDKGKIKPATDWVVFFSYVSFFPSLISGPIDRANALIPQLEKKRIFTYEQGTDALRQILWGLFKKIVIADNCATITNQIFNNYGTMSASTLLLCAVLFTIQLYADFSGYTDMAIGFARLIGFNITKNFNFPFFAQNIAEYWRRWHMSLTSWLTDYVFTPLSITFRDYGKFGLFLAILLNMITVGAWHGANWTFILFGVLHGLYFIPLIIRGTMSKKKKTTKIKWRPSLVEFRNMVGTFTLVMLTNVIFRVESISQAFDFYYHLFSKSLFSVPSIIDGKTFIIILSFSCLLFAIEWIQRDKQHGLQLDNVTIPKVVRWGFYYGIGASIIWLGGSQQDFIYFQF
jgi:alginate O-acetyltransferase complex protein AlgI